MHIMTLIRHSCGAMMAPERIDVHILRLQLPCRLPPLNSIFIACEDLQPTSFSPK
jgi:hypothetical protein